MPQSVCRDNTHKWHINDNNSNKAAEKHTIIKISFLPLALSSSSFFSPPLSPVRSFQMANSIILISKSLTIRIERSLKVQSSIKCFLLFFSPSLPRLSLFLSNTYLFMFFYFFFFEMGKKKFCYVFMAARVSEHFSASDKVFETFKQTDREINNPATKNRELATLFRFLRFENIP